MRWYHLRLWYGMDLSTWLRLLSRNRFRISLRRTLMAIAVTVVAIGNTIGKLVQYLLVGRTLREVVIEKDPVFIIGHWRSGTTMVREILALDSRHKYPGTYECLAPHHGILTKGLMHRWEKWLLSSNLPMDPMTMGWERPQEDELALCAMGQSSIYTSLAFPHHAAQGTEALDFEGVQPEDLEDRVFDIGEKLFRSFNKSRHLVAAERICTVRLEDLVSDLQTEMERIYSELGIEGFGDLLLPNLTAHLAEQHEWRVTEYEEDPSLRSRVERRWGPTFSEFGYPASTQIPNATMDFTDPRCHDVARSVS